MGARIVLHVGRMVQPPCPHPHQPYVVAAAAAAAQLLPERSTGSANSSFIWMLFFLFSIYFAPTTINTTATTTSSSSSTITMTDCSMRHRLGPDPIMALLVRLRRSWEGRLKRKGLNGLTGLYFVALTGVFR